MKTQDQFSKSVGSQVSQKSCVDSFFKLSVKTENKRKQTKQAKLRKTKQTNKKRCAYATYRNTYTRVIFSFLNCTYCMFYFHYPDARSHFKISVERFENFTKSFRLCKKKRGQKHWTKSLYRNRLKKLEKLWTCLYPLGKAYWLNLIIYIVLLFTKKCRWTTNKDPRETRFSLKSIQCSQIIHWIRYHYITVI